MRRREVLLRGAAAVVFGGGALPAAARSRFPTVRDLEGGLGLSPGTPIPKIVPALGRGWQPVYEGARALGGGVYEVRIRLA